MSETKVCERCERADCEIYAYSLTLGDRSVTLTPKDPQYAMAVTCAYRAASLKATYKARAEAAEGKVERVRELADGYAAHQYTGGGDYGTGAEETFHSVADDILEALNGKPEPFDANDLPF